MIKIVKKLDKLKKVKSKKKINIIKSHLFLKSQSQAMINKKNKK